MTDNDNDELHIAACTCSECVEACTRNPGWFGPEDAEKALNAGLASKMMLDYWAGSPNIYVLAPASQGREGTIAPEMTWHDAINAMFGDWHKGQCVLLKNNRCTIHDSGYKPYQCINMCNNSPMRDMWDSKKGRALIARWRAETGCNEEAP